MRRPTTLSRASAIGRYGRPSLSWLRRERIMPAQRGPQQSRRQRQARCARGDNRTEPTGLRACDGCWSATIAGGLIRSVCFGIVPRRYSDFRFAGGTYLASSGRRGNQCRGGRNQRRPLGAGSLKAACASVKRYPRKQLRTSVAPKLKVKKAVHN